MFLPYTGETVVISLRDENVMRQRALPPAVYGWEGLECIAPMDPSGGGTWIAANERGDVVVLLNGAFEKHQNISHTPLRSRGTIVKVLASAKDLLYAWNGLYLNDVEPFTIVILQTSQLCQLVWDGSEKHHISHDPDKPAIWSSSTLYNREARDKKRAYFQELLTTEIPPVDRLLDELKSYNDSVDGFYINRNDELLTLSTTAVTIDNAQVAMRYEDHLAQASTYQKIDFSPQPSLARE